MREQVKILEYQSKIRMYFPRLITLRILSDPLVVNVSDPLSHIADLAAIDLLQHGRTAQQRRFTGAGRSDDRENLTLFYRKRDILQYAKPVKFFFNMLHFQQLHVLPPAIL